MRIKYLLPGMVLVVVGIALRVHGGDTDIGPINPQAAGNVLWVLGAAEIALAVASRWFPERE